VVNYSHAFGYYLLTENKSSDLNTPVYFSNYAITKRNGKSDRVSQAYLRTGKKIKGWGANTGGK
jgi:hypothetical protein